MRKHTTIDLDVDLVRQAADVLGAKTITGTIHAALSEVVRVRLRLDVLRSDPALSLADLRMMRADRFSEDAGATPSDEHRPTHRRAGRP